MSRTGETVFLSRALSRWTQSVLELVDLPGKYDVQRFASLFQAGAAVVLALGERGRIKTYFSDSDMAPFISCNKRRMSSR